MDFSTPFGQEVLRIGNLIDSLNKSHQDAKNLDDERYPDILKAIIHQVESMRGALPNKGKTADDMKKEEEAKKGKNEAPSNKPFAAEAKKEETKKTEEVKHKEEPKK